MRLAGHARSCSITPPTRLPLVTFSFALFKPRITSAALRRHKLQLHTACRDTFDEVVLRHCVNDKRWNKRDNRACHDGRHVARIRTLERLKRNLQCVPLGVLQVQVGSEVVVVAADEAE